MKLFLYTDKSKQELILPLDLNGVLRLKLSLIGQLYLNSGGLVMGLSGIQKHAKMTSKSQEQGIHTKFNTSRTQSQLSCQVSETDTF